MAGTVTPALTEVSLCNAVGSWIIESGCSGAPVLNTDVPLEGSGCIHSYNAGAALRGQKWDLGAGGTNLQNQTIYCWFAFSNINNIPVIGSTGLRLRLTDTSGNYSEWDLAGSDTLPHGGWLSYATRTSVTPARNSGSPANLASIRYVGWICGGSVVGKTYIYHDAWRYGTGLNIKGGTSGAPATFEDFITAEATNAYGVIAKVFGVYYAQGVLSFGSTTGGESTYFKDVGKIVVFKDTPVGDGFYNMLLQGNGSANTEIYFGNLTGGRGIQGCLFKTASASQTPKFTVTATDTNITKFGFYGCTFQDAGIIYGQAYNADKQFIDCSFAACRRMEPGTGKVQYCNFIGSPGSAIKLDSILHHTDYSNFINCVDGVEITAAGDAYPFPALMFTGCTYDVLNSGASAAVYIDPTASSNVSTHHETAGGTTTINAPSITLTISGLVDGSDVVIYDAGTTTMLVNVQENSGSTYAYYYPSTDAGSQIDVGVYLPGYRPKKVYGYTLSASSASLPITQVIDPDYVE
jgi:hypothetical protein